MDNDKVLEKAMSWINEHRPDASDQKKAAFANSVAYLVTGWSGGYGGPSVREHAAARLKTQKPSWTFEEACAELNRDDGVIFGPITDLHRLCWEQEHCFDDDPEDLKLLQGSS